MISASLEDHREAEALPRAPRPRMAAPLDDQAHRIARLSRMLPGIPVRTEPYYLISYSFDATGTRGSCGGVAFPKSLDDLRRVLAAAARERVPIYPRGAGSGFTGGSVPLDGGLVVSTERLRRVVGFDAAREEVEVEAGVVNKELQDFLEPRGYFYPPDPASLNFSTIGGNVAENAGGPRAFKYGVTRRYVRSLTWVTAGGEVVEREPARGPTAALVGAEGTLGMIYEARLRVVPLPDAYRTSLLEFAPGTSALAFAGASIAAGVAPGVLEFLDWKTMACVAEYCCVAGLNRKADYLFIEFDGTAGEVDRQQALLAVRASKSGVVIRAARSSAERDLLWKVRRSVSPSLARRGVTKVNEDVSLPVGRLEEAVRFTHEIAHDLDLDCYLFGHAGDGNMHVNIMTDRRRTEEMLRVEEFVRRLFVRVVELGGTLSGEHGIGLTKSPYLGLVFSPGELALERAIKRAMDPRGILNPGKYFTFGGTR
jgi:glycolate oxidase